MLRELDNLASAPDTHAISNWEAPYQELALKDLLRDCAMLTELHRGASEGHVNQAAVSFVVLQKLLCPGKFGFSVLA